MPVPDIKRHARATTRTFTYVSWRGFEERTSRAYWKCKHCGHAVDAWNGVAGIRRHVREKHRALYYAVPAEDYLIEEAF